jgi:hypothetical protein
MKRPGSSIPLSAVIPKRDTCHRGQRMDDTPSNPNRRGGASLARETNGHIRAIATSLRDRGRIGFLCECGCLDIATITIGEYDAEGGAWLEGHKPT